MMATEQKGNNPNNNNRPTGQFGGPGGGQRGAGGNRPQRRSGRTPREQAKKSEFDHRVIQVRRVARVVAGGRRFSFSVVLVAGDRKGRIGLGTGKALDTQLATEKAMKIAERTMIKIPLTKDQTISHDVFYKFGSSVVMIRPARGRGLVAGSAVRVVLDLAGVKHANAKILSRSKNKLNIARATVKALATLKKKEIQ